MYDVKVLDCSVDLEAGDHLAVAVPVEVLELASGLARVVDRPRLASMRQNVQVSVPVGTRANIAPLSLSRPTFAMIVSLRLRKASFLANSPHALANAASPR